LTLREQKVILYSHCQLSCSWFFKWKMYRKTEYSYIYKYYVLQYFNNLVIQIPFHTYELVITLGNFFMQFWRTGGSLTLLEKQDLSCSKICFSFQCLRCTHMLQGNLLWEKEGSSQNYSRNIFKERLPKWFSTTSLYSHQNFPKFPFQSPHSPIPHSSNELPLPIR
jgi:hypothetical protein